MRDPSPVIVLIPGLGLLAFQTDKQTARVAAEFYESTIRIVRWAESVDEYVPIPEQEAFDIEYWSLEEAKLHAAASGEEPAGACRRRDRRRRRDRPRDSAPAARRGGSSGAVRRGPGRVGRRSAHAGGRARRRSHPRGGMRRAT